MIQPHYLRISSLFQGRLFRIPDFQRMYSWEKRQRRDLFDDIMLAEQKDREHFLATIVCLHRGEKTIGSDPFEVYDVVDGQQRLTTIVTLLKAIEKDLARNNDAESKGLQEWLVKQKSDTELLLQTNHDNADLFGEYLRTGKAPAESHIATDGDRRLQEAINECEQFVSEWKGLGKNSEDLLALIKRKLTVVFYAFEDEASVYNVFEVLNSRGIPVDWLDKTKSMLMGVAYERYDPSIREEKIRNLKEIWGDVYRELAKEAVPGHEVVRFAATLKDPTIHSKPLSASDAFDQLKVEAERHQGAERDVSALIRDVVKATVSLYDDPRLAAVTTIAHARLLAVAIELSQAFTESEKRALLSEWERVSFFLFGLHRKDARTAVGDFTRTAQQVFLRQLTTVPHVKAAFDEITDGYTIETAIEELKASRDSYTSWSEELRYLLYKYEQHLCVQNGEELDEATWAKIWSRSPTKSVEHILPQDPGDEWKGKLGHGQRADRHVHRLGNLALLPPGVNSHLSNKGFKEKRLEYRNQPLRHVREVAQYRDWSTSKITEREEALFEWIRKEWG